MLLEVESRRIEGVVMHVRILTFLVVTIEKHPRTGGPHLSQFRVRWLFLPLPLFAVVPCFIALPHYYPRLSRVLHFRITPFFDPCITLVIIVVCNM
jgi:hypothetical protein